LKSWQLLVSIVKFLWWKAFNFPNSDHQIDISQYFLVKKKQAQPASNVSALFLQSFCPFRLKLPPIEAFCGGV